MWHYSGNQVTQKTYTPSLGYSPKNSIKSQSLLSLNFHVLGSPTIQFYRVTSQILSLNIMQYQEFIAVTLLLSETHILSFFIKLATSEMKVCTLATTNDSY